MTTTSEGMTTRRTITEGEAEKIIDRRLDQALSTSHSYQYAENAEEQAEAEQRLADEIERDVYREYVVSR